MGLESNPGAQGRGPKVEETAKAWGVETPPKTQPRSCEAHVQTTKPTYLVF